MMILKLLAAAIALGGMFAWAFLSSCLSLQHWILPMSSDAVPWLTFPLIASLFYLPGLKNRTPFQMPKMALSVLPAALIAFVYGLFLSRASGQPVYTWQILVWFLFSSPVGEEMLFRGWFYSLFRTHSTAAAIGASSVAFSLWHLQNAGVVPVPLLLFQLTYTFFAGVWLGVLRAQSGSILVPLLAHVALNAATTAGTWIPW